jgi:hypothetical protein
MLQFKFVIIYILLMFIALSAGLVHQNLSYPWPSMLKQSITHGFLWACDLECCLKQKSQVSDGMSQFCL